MRFASKEKIISKIGVVTNKENVQMKLFIYLKQIYIINK
jgi:hypothetical protein